MKKGLDKIGEVFENDRCLVFFGDKRATIEKIRLMFPEARLLKQVHGDTLVFSTKQVVEADAHWTRDKHLPLLIKTADCLPIMIHSPRENLALAIHAGWRGVEQRITSKSLTELKMTGDPGLRVWIGPHIQFRSFVVDRDVSDSLLKSHFLKWNGNQLRAERGEFTDFAKVMPDLPVVERIGGERSGEKFLVNLSWLVMWELFLCGVKPKQIHISDEDTKSNPDLHSFRRGEKDVRNYNFILLK